MKHLLNGVAIAAALAIAGPVWAQAPAASSPPKPAAAAPAAGAPMAPMAGAPMAPMAGKQRHKRMHRAMAKRGKMGGGRMGGGDTMTDQLNREELARLQGAAPPPPPQPGGGAGQGGPRPSGH